MNSPSFYLELGQSSLKGLHGERGLELPLERLPNGRLTAACKQRLSAALVDFVRKGPFGPRPRLYCAIGARGVSLRRLTLPAASKENLERLLALQIENEFPLPPDELAWGYRLLGEAKRQNGSPAQQELLVAALKKEVLDEYAEVFSACGAAPLFTLAAMARQYLCPPSTGLQAVLDLGRQNSELICFDHGVATAVRVLPWGGESLTTAIGTELGVGHEEAEKLKVKWQQAAAGDAELRTRIQAANEKALDELADGLNEHWSGQRLYVTGRPARQKDLVARLAQRLGPGVVCESLEPAQVDGVSAAVLGLRAAAENGSRAQPLLLQAKPTNGAATVARPVAWSWIALAALLALGLWVLPYAEALVLKPFLAKKLTAIKAERSRLAMIDQEWNFLQHLKENQPPYLDALFLFSKSAPPGARLDSVSMNRRGDISLRGSMKDSQQVADFRSKLIDSGFFENVTVEEQNPTPDRQKLNVRMGAQWKSVAARQTLAIGPTAEEIEKAKNKVRDQPGGPPMMGMPMVPGPGPGGPGMTIPGRPVPGGATSMPAPGVRVRTSTSVPPPGGARPTVVVPGSGTAPMPPEATPPPAP